MGGLRWVIRVTVVVVATDVRLIGLNVHQMISA